MSDEGGERQRKVSGWGRREAGCRSDGSRVVARVNPTLSHPGSCGGSDALSIFFLLFDILDFGIVYSK
jgi:hypothetical protein